MSRSTPPPPPGSSSTSTSTRSYGRRKPKKIVKLINCRIVYDTYMSHGNDQLWFTEYHEHQSGSGRIVDQQEIFYSHCKAAAHDDDYDHIIYETIDCQNHIVTPGYIDLQINGGWGYDFSSIDDVVKNSESLRYISRQLLRHGVTSYCPTVVSSDQSTYSQMLPVLQRFVAEKQTTHRKSFKYHDLLHGTDAKEQGKKVQSDSDSGRHADIEREKQQGRTGRKELEHEGDIDHNKMRSDSEQSGKSTISQGDGGVMSQAIGIHLEGPFISVKGAHNPSALTSPVNGIESLLQRYCHNNPDKLNHVSIITLAPELPGAARCIGELNQQYPSITVSCGHSQASTQEAENVLSSNEDGGGARMITHIFNAMNPFHHRDPGIIGCLGSNNTSYYFGIISDGQHTHPYSIVIAHKCHPSGLVLVTDAMSALGLPSGTYKLGGSSVDVVGDTARIAGTETLAGSIASMDECVRNFYRFTSCSIMEAVHAATLHPAKAMRMSHRIGSLRIGNKADICVVDDELNVKAVFTDGKLAWQEQGTLIYKRDR